MGDATLEATKMNMVTMPVEATSMAKSLERSLRRFVNPVGPIRTVTTAALIGAMNDVASPSPGQRGSYGTTSRTTADAESGIQAVVCAD